MSSMMAMRGGTASNGGSVPITPITGPPMGMGMNLALSMSSLDGDESLDYYSRLGDGLDSGMMGDEDMVCFFHRLDISDRVCRQWTVRRIHSSNKRFSAHNRWTTDVVTRTPKKLPPG